MTCYRYYYSISRKDASRLLMERQLSEIGEFLDTYYIIGTENGVDDRYYSSRQKYSSRGGFSSIEWCLVHRQSDSTPYTPEISKSPILTENHDIEDLVELLSVKFKRYQGETNGVPYYVDFISQGDKIVTAHCNSDDEISMFSTFAKDYKLSPAKSKLATMLKFEKDMLDFYGDDVNNLRMDVGVNWAGLPRLGTATKKEVMELMELLK